MGKTRLVRGDFRDVSLSPRQKEYSEVIRNNSITICWGPAGSSKTFSACYTALDMLAKRKVEKIILTKPIQEAGEKIGTLPGDIWEKISPHMESFIVTMEKIIDPTKLSALVSDDIIQYKPLSYLRGTTFDNSIMILDEAQNCDMKGLMLYVTRLGKDTKVVLSGDVTQHDISRDRVALPTFSKMVDGIDDVNLFEFTEKDIVRAEILKQIVKRYEAWKNEKDTN